MSDNMPNHFDHKDNRFYWRGHLKRTIPKGATPTIPTTLSSWQDLGVMYESGVIGEAGDRFVRVTHDPMKRQYVLLENGVYQFSEQDHEATIIITYAYRP